MRGGHLNGKYSSRGGASYRGSSFSGQYGGYYHDPYYSSSPARGARGGFRGRGSSSGSSAGAGAGGPGRSAHGAGPDYYGSPVRYSNISYMPSSSPAGSSSVSNGNSASTPSGGDIPASGSDAAASAVAGQGLSGDAAVPTDTPSHAAAGESGAGTYTRPPFGPEAGAGAGSAEYHGDGYEHSRWNQYNDYSGRGRGGFASSRYSRGRARGRGRGGVRGTWSGPAHYYSSGYEGSYDRGPGGGQSSQYYYGRQASAEYVPYSKEPKGVYSEAGAKADGSLGRDGAEAAAKAAERRKSEQDKAEKERELAKEVEFREKHWVGRIHATGEARKSLSKGFDELDTVNASLLRLGAHRLELEIDVNRYNRVLKTEEERSQVAEERLESMNLSI